MARAIAPPNLRFVVRRVVTRKGWYFYVHDTESNKPASRLMADGFQVWDRATFLNNPDGSFVSYAHAYGVNDEPL